MRKLLFISAILYCTGLFAQDWINVPVPADAGLGKVWKLQEEVSDDFNYEYQASTSKTNFGENRWYNYYHANWSGPGTTYWKYDKVSVDGSDLVIVANRWDKNNDENPSAGGTVKMSRPDGGIATGCVTSNNRVLYPVFVEAKISVANIALASDVWLLSASDKQEIDIIECYGGAQNGNSYFAQFIHLSHHSFIRSPFTDYQPRDKNSWYKQSGISSWGDYCWNNGARKYVQVGVNWIDPFHFEYYIDGNLVRVVYQNAFASKVGSTWYYTYPTKTDGALDFDGGYQKVITHSTSTAYSFSKLESASNISEVSVIDPYEYQQGNGFTEELDIIINVESQDWHVEAGRTPTDAELADPSMNTMKVDWIRVYKPEFAETAAVSGVAISEKNKESFVGANFALSAVVSPENASNKTILWKSDNETVATVNAAGEVNCLSSGEANIIVTTQENAITDTCALSVLDISEEGSINFDDRQKYLTTSYKVGGKLAIQADFTSGTGTVVGADGITFWLREMEPNWAAVANDYTAVDKSVVGLSKGSASVEISLENASATADLAEGHFYFLWASFMQSDGENVVNTQNMYPIILEKPNALNDVFMENVQIFPNPVKDEIRFISEGEFVSYVLFSLTGDIVKKGDLSSKKINVSDLQSGNYILGLKTKTNKHRYKGFVKL